MNEHLALIKVDKKKLYVLNKKENNFLIDIFDIENEKHIKTINILIAKDENYLNYKIINDSLYIFSFVNIDENFSIKSTKIDIKLDDFIEKKLLASTWDKETWFDDYEFDVFNDDEEKISKHNDNCFTNIFGELRDDIEIFNVRFYSLDENKIKLVFYVNYSEDSDYFYIGNQNYVYTIEYNMISNEKKEFLVNVDIRKNLNLDDDQVLINSLEEIIDESGNFYNFAIYYFDLDEDELPYYNNTKLSKYCLGINEIKDGKIETYFYNLTNFSKKYKCKDIDIIKKNNQFEILYLISHNIPFHYDDDLVYIANLKFNLLNKSFNDYKELNILDNDSLLKSMDAESLIPNLISYFNIIDDKIIVLLELVVNPKNSSFSENGGTWISSTNIFNLKEKYLFILNKEFELLFSKKFDLINSFGINIYAEIMTSLPYCYDKDLANGITPSEIFTQVKLIDNSLFLLYHRRKMDENKEFFNLFEFKIDLNTLSSENKILLNYNNDYVTHNNFIEFDNEKLVGISRNSFGIFGEDKLFILKKK